MSAELNTTNECPSAAFRGFATNLAFFLLGGGVGAAIGLLFAPKAGRELRADIADEAVKRYDQTIEAASSMKAKASYYVEEARDLGGDIAESISEKASAIKEELVEGAGEIKTKVTDAVRVARESAQAMQLL